MSCSVTAHETQPAALVPHWNVAQAAVALRPPLSPAALGPFGLMLLSVAVLPLWHPHWWDDNANRLKVLRSSAIPPTMPAHVACAGLRSEPDMRYALQPCCGMPGIALPECL